MNGRITLRDLAVLLISFLYSTIYGQGCIPSIRTFLPDTNGLNGNGYGYDLDVHHDFMVAGAPYHETQQNSDGEAYVYQLDAPSQQWIKIATLSPSDPQNSMDFGYHVAIDDNLIALSATIYSDNGSAVNKVYIYEKDPLANWTSTTETTQLPGYGFELENNELIIQNTVNNKARLEIYKKDTGGFVLGQVIENPIDKSGAQNSFVRLAVTSNMIVGCNDQFKNADGSIGAAFLWEKNGTSWPATPTARFLPLLNKVSDWVGFGAQVSITNTTVFIAASNLLKTTGNYKSGVYVFEKPITGWIDTKKTYTILSDNQQLFSFGMVSNENYVIISGTQVPVEGFKKNGPDWASGVTSFKLPDPYLQNGGNRMIKMNNNHLLIGVYPNSSSTNQHYIIADYYQPAGDWENTHLPTQILSEDQYSSANSQFGLSLNVHENTLWVSARRDNEKMPSAGAVYGFNTNNQGVAPAYKIFSVKPQSDSYFGATVALGDSIMITSAIHEDSLNSNGSLILPSIGKVYVYLLTYQGWKYHTQLKAPQIKKSQSFGFALAYTKGYLAVSEIDLSTSQSHGRVHMYKERGRGDFEYIATMRSTDDLGGDLFGQEILLNDSIMVIGTGGREYSIYNQVKVYVYKKKVEWKSGVEDARLIPTTKKTNDYFGYSIAMSENEIIVGSPGYYNANTSFGEGAVYIFKKPAKGWSGTINESARLLPSDPTTYGFFGYSLAYDHGDLFIGAPHSIMASNFTNFITNNDGRLKPGKVYHFIRPAGDWQSSSNEAKQITSSAPHWLDGFGSSLAIVNRKLYIGSALANTPSGFRSGNVQSETLLPSIVPLAKLCVSQNEVQMRSSPEGGVWNGPAINAVSGKFSPSLAGTGKHNIAYTFNGCTVNTLAEVTDLSIQIENTSPAEQQKCSTEKKTIQLQSTATNDRYQWSFKSHENENYRKIDSLKKEIQVITPGFYQLQIKPAFCSAPYSADFKITNDLEAIIQIDPPPIICSDKIIQLQSTPQGGTWTSSTGHVSDKGRFDPDKNGTFTITYSLTSPLGCNYKKSIDVVVDLLSTPQITQEGDQICADNAVGLLLQNIDSNTDVQWMNTSRPAEVIGKDLAITITQPGNYFAQATKHGCSIQTLPIKIDALKDSITIPNVFTPNGDSFNDYFAIAGSDLNHFSIHIYNRYGTQVYETTEPLFNWNGGDLATGVYFWRINYVNCANVSREKKGWVQIIR